jgi:hypothetical protein
MADDEGQGVRLQLLARYCQLPERQNSGRYPEGGFNLF